ncbi:MAG: hypothetical protein KC475_12320, partial [Cyanobacteria bacterium HKST-UBA03]|nr:hypothetical protein [Cyanobacteria bacterium HKST-UBA03]
LSHNLILQLSKAQNLALPESAQLALNNQHPLMERVAHSTDGSHSAAAAAMLRTLYGAHYDTMNEQRGKWPFLKRPESRQQQAYTSFLLGEALPPIFRADLNLSSLPLIKELLQQINHPTHGTPADVRQARIEMMRDARFWNNVAHLYNLAAPNDVGTATPNNGDPNDKMVGTIIKHWISNPQQTLNRLEATQTLLSQLDTPSKARRRWRTIEFNSLHIALSAPLSDAAANDTLLHYARHVAGANNTLNLFHLATAMLVSNSHALLEAPGWSREYYNAVLGPDAGSRVRQFHAQNDVAETQVAAPLPLGWVRIYANRHRNPLGNPDDQRAIVNVTPFMHHMDFALLQPYAAHVDSQALSQNNWGVETEMMYLLGHPKIMQQHDEAALRITMYAITAPAAFAENQVPKIKEPMWHAWYHIARLSHSFRALKFDAAGGNNSVLAQYGFRLFTPRATDAQFGPGFYTTPKQSPHADLPANSLIEFRRGYLLCSVPGSGTLVVRNASTNPHFNVRSILTAPAYYSPRVLTFRDLLSLNPATDNRFKSILTPGLYGGAEGSNPAIIKLTQILGDFFKDYSQWKADFADPELHHPAGPQIFGRGGFEAITRRLQAQLQESPDRRYWLALYSPHKAPFSAYPYNDPITGEEERMLPVDEKVLHEMTLALEGQFVDVADGEPPTAFQRLIQTGLNNRAYLVVEDGHLY